LRRNQKTGRRRVGAAKCPIALSNSERFVAVDQAGRRRAAAHHRSTCFAKLPTGDRLEHDPEKWILVFGKDHAPPMK
jgi:hypothetical protein